MLGSPYSLKAKPSGFSWIACRVSCESQSRVGNDSMASGLRQMSPTYYNKESCRTRIFGGDDRELHLGHVQLSEDIHQTPGYLSLELWGGVWAQSVSVWGISSRMAFKAKRWGWGWAKQSPTCGDRGDVERPA